MSAWAVRQIPKETNKAKATATKQEKRVSSCCGPQKKHVPHVHRWWGRGSISRALRKEGRKQKHHRP